MSTITPSRRQRETYDATAPTPTERSVLAIVTRTLTATGQSPTIREICTELGWTSTQTAWARLRSLTKKGLLTRDRCYSQRGYRLPRSKDADAVRAALMRVAVASLQLEALMSAGGFLIRPQGAVAWREWQATLKALRETGWQPPTEGE